MGGCAISFMSMRNNAKMIQNPDIQAVRKIDAQSVEVGEDVPGCSRIRRSPSMAGVTYEDLVGQFYGGGEGSLVAMLKQVALKNPTRPAMKWRPIEKFEKAEIEENGKKKQWEFIHLAETKSLNFGEMWGKMVAFGNGLKELGLASEGSRVGMYEETRYEWMASCYGLWTQGLVGVTVYANLGEDALEYAIKEAELSVVICNAKGVKTMEKISKATGITCPTLIYTDELPADYQPSVTTYKWADVVAKGEGKPEPELTAKPDDTALIMYTSGTTGDPKGVVISHGNVVAAVLGLSRRMAQFLGETSNDDDTYVAYLPLAHILEFSAENVMLLRGSTICYGNPRTLTNTSAKPHGDLQEFKPIFFAGVPRIYDTIKKGVEGKLPPAGSLKRRVFDKAFEERRAALSKGMDTPYWNDAVFANPRQMLGGRVRALISGGAPLSAKTQEFLSIVFGCSVGQGYGLTETCACGTIQRYWDIQTENIGGLLPSVEIKLKDTEEWKHTDKPEPRGEICIRGPVVTQGYYKQEEKTKEAFMEDGWFHTGDVGKFCEDGTVKIIGRVKALAKNAFGEYVALDALESTYVLNDLCLPNGVCVLVDSQKSFITALVLTDQAKAMKFAADKNIQGEWPEILKNPEFQKKAAESLAATAKENGKKPFECVKKVAVLNEEWTPENGVLTAAMKLKRRVVDKQYAETIAELFAE